MKLNKETYLGDGLYASFDGWMIKLRAPREHGDHWVALEPGVIESFERFVSGVREYCAEARARAEAEMGSSMITITGETGVCGTPSYTIDASLEPQTRVIMAAMGGRQPSEFEWTLFFNKTGATGGMVGSMSSEIADKMRLAHNVARNPEPSPKRTP